MVQKRQDDVGVGFGPNVALGSALLVLDSQLIKGIHQLKHQGIADDINISIRKLSELHQFLPNIDALKDGKIVLIGDSNGLKEINGRLISALAPVQQWYRNDAMSLRDVKEKLLCYVNYS